MSRKTKSGIEVVERGGRRKRDKKKDEPLPRYSYKAPPRAQRALMPALKDGVERRSGPLLINVYDALDPRKRCQRWIMPGKPDLHRTRKGALHAS
jgi:hypothetical protein